MYSSNRYEANFSFEKYSILKNKSCSFKVDKQKCKDSKFHISLNAVHFYKKKHSLFFHINCVRENNNSHIHNFWKCFRVYA